MLFAHSFSCLPVQHALKSHCRNWAPFCLDQNCSAENDAGAKKPNPFPSPTPLSTFLKRFGVRINLPHHSAPQQAGQEATYLLFKPQACWLQSIGARNPPTLNVPGAPCKASLGLEGHYQFPLLGPGGLSQTPKCPILSEKPLAQIHQWVNLLLRSILLL